MAGSHDLTLLERTKIQAEVLIPLIKEMTAEIRSGYSDHPSPMWASAGATLSSGFCGGSPSRTRSNSRGEGENRRRA